MIARTLALTCRSHSMALHQYFFYFEFTLFTLLIVHYVHSTYRSSLLPEFLMTLALRSYGHPEGPSCSRSSTIGSSFSNTPAYFVTYLLILNSIYFVSIKQTFLFHSDTLISTPRSKSKYPSPPTQ